jgi:hypothetical protein
MRANLSLPYCNESKSLLLLLNLFIFQFAGVLLDDALFKNDIKLFENEEKRSSQLYIFARLFDWATT